MGDVQILHRLAYSLHELKGRGPLLTQEHRHKFLPAISGEQVRGTMEMGCRRLGYGRDDLISRRMTEGVIIQLELIDIEHADGEGDLETDRLPPARCALILISSPIGHTGKLVDHGPLLELHLIMIKLDVGVHPSLDDHRFKRLRDIIHRPQQESPLLVLHVG